MLIGDENLRKKVLMDFKLSNNKDIMVEFHDENGNRVLGRLIEDFMSNN